jgi:hypothetical protein
MDELRGAQVKEDQSFAPNGPRLRRNDLAEDEVGTLTIISQKN